jgi:hypothetical protein
VARPEGIEPPTLCLEGRRSIRLSYGRCLTNFSHYKRLRHNLFQFFSRTFSVQSVPLEDEIEPSKLDPAPILSAIVHGTSRSS